MPQKNEKSVSNDWKHYAFGPSNNQAIKHLFLNTTLISHFRFYRFKNFKIQYEI